MSTSSTSTSTTSTTTSSSTSSSTTTTTTAFYTEELALCTVEEVKDFGRLVNLSSDSEDEVERLIDAVGSLFNKYTNRTLGLVSLTEIHNGDGTGKLFPKNYPIITVRNLNEDSSRVFGASTLIDPDDYSIIDDVYIQLHDTSFGEDIQNVEIEYVSGYDPIPPDIKQACIEQVLWLFKKGEGHRIGQSAKTQGDSTISFRTSALLEEVKLVLNLYRKRKI